MAVGQGSLTATPLQVVRMMAAVANGGLLVTPHVAAGRASGQASGTAANSRDRTAGLRPARRWPPFARGSSGRWPIPKGTAHGALHLE